MTDEDERMQKQAKPSAGSASFEIYWRLSVSEQNPVRVLLVDDEPTLCSALRLLLEQEAELTVVGEAKESNSAYHQAEVLQPDLLLLDWELPGTVGAAFVVRLRNDVPGLRIIALSSRPEARLAALDAGADAFVSKGDPPDSLLMAIRQLQSRLD
jgi:DNA-binding NarL/FixJ family response regulator